MLKFEQILQAPKGSKFSLLKEPTTEFFRGAYNYPIIIEKTTDNNVTINFSGIRPHDKRYGYITQSLTENMFKEVQSIIIPFQEKNMQAIKVLYECKDFTVKETK